ncbi:MAG TPA: MMPL family transporter [Anaeromyxobacteraceae bacterium]
MSGAPASAAGGAVREASPFARRLVTWGVRRRGVVLGAALAAAALGGAGGARLYGDLRSGLEELLPDGAPSVVAVRTLGPLLHTVTHLSVVFQGRDGDALGRLADDAAARIRALPRDLVETVEYRTDELEAFARRFGGLYLDVRDLDEIQARLDRRVAWEKRRANPLLGLLEDEDAAPAPPLELSDIERKYAAVQGLSRFRSGYFQTPDGRILVLLVRPPQSATGLESNQRLLAAVRREVEALEPVRYDPAIRVGYDGEVATLVEEQGALASDLASSAAVVLVLVTLVMWLYFRRWSAMAAIFGALGVGCALTFGLARLLVGYLNANTAFLGSIVVGNGVHVSIVAVARYLEERRRGLGLEDALAVAWSRTAAATFVASFAAALSYACLAATDFRGFSQFGLIGGTGMALCWATAYLLLPSLLAWLDAGRPVGPAPRRHRLLGAWSAALARRHGRALRVGSLALAALAAAGVLAYRGDPVEYDLSKLRAARSARSGAQYWGARVDEVFREYLTPIVVHARTAAELDRVVAELERARAALGPADPLREVRTVASLVPPDQEAKLPRLARLRDSLGDARLARLDPATRALALRLRPPVDLRPVTLADVPAALRLPLVERDGTVGRVALAFPRKVGLLNPQEMQGMTALVRDAVARAGASAQPVGQALLFVDIATAILRDGPVAAALSLAAVVALVALALRRLAPVAQVAGSLLLGVAWLVGAAAWAGVKLNFLNFVVLPITFGIGVDYAVNIVQRFRADGEGSLERVLGETGGAVALCSLTTVIGYASLLVADNRALRGFGLLASLGEVSCVAAGLLALPAWLLRGAGSEGAAGAAPGAAA